MTFYYCPGSKHVSRGQRFGLLARWRLAKRRKHTDDLANLKGVWV